MSIDIQEQDEMVRKFVVLNVMAHFLFIISVGQQYSVYTVKNQLTNHNGA